MKQRSRLDKRAATVSCRARCPMTEHSGNARARSPHRLPVACTFSENDLARGIAAEQMVLHYQPEISFHDRRLVGFEALLRWNHPLYGLLRPADFIPSRMAPQLVNALGKWVLRAACAQMAAWNHAIPLNAPLAVGVNTSLEYLVDPLLIPNLLEILEGTSLHPQCLHLEMPESSIMVHGETTTETLRQLKAMRIGLEIDDFGTGHDSLGYLRRLPFDTLKIDRSFVQELGTANDSSEIIAAVLTFAGSLGMTVAAEGVETQDQFDRLTALGCRRGQGHYFSKPVGAASAELLIRNERKGDKENRSSIHLL
jgi:EAL domain-containing protein (putative c-di-GMP-specific phosphodiesterase class I)